MLRSIRKIHKAEYRPIADLETYSPLPTRSLQQIDPFLFLNHHGPQVYPPGNHGLPFGPHPHRGMETVTFILEGDIMHKDSNGNKSVITAGGVQWMTAGSGLIHAEVSSDEFKKNGGPLEILQLWLNLPAKLKMTKPEYKGLQKKDIPEVKKDDGTINLISGKIDTAEGPFESKTGITIYTIDLKQGGKMTLSVSTEHNVFFYVIRGSVDINDAAVVPAFHLAEFNNDKEDIQIKAESDAVILFGHGKPFNEPVFAQGPFVMNTQEEIMQAYSDYKLGKFGTWEE